MATTSSTALVKLALDGGPKVRTAPWPSRALFGEEEKRAVVEVLNRSIREGNAFGYGGVEEEAYTRAFAEFLGGGFADGVNSGTNAVYVALRAVNPEPFTEVIVPPISDPGGFMPVPLCNCVPVVADAAPGSYNTDAQRIAERITPRTSAILVAHISGIPVEMDAVMELARSRNIPVIEDCAQAHGATYRGQPVGTFGDLAAFSTMFGKHHATGGQGGVVFTRDEQLHWRARRAADRGKPFGMTGQASNVLAALNCNMDELHAALGRAQLAKLPSIVSRRRATAAAVAEGCRKKLRSVRLVTGPRQGESSYWFFFFHIDTSLLKVDKAAFVRAVTAEGIPGVEAGYWHCALDQDWYRNRSVFGLSRLPWSSPQYTGPKDAVYEVPNARATEATHFRAGVHENWTAREVEDLVAALEKVEKAYLK